MEMLNESDKERVRQRVLTDPIVQRLMNNPNWEPAARAAVAELIDNKPCPVNSWRKSSTWQQVKMVYNDVVSRTTT